MTTDADGAFFWAGACEKINSARLRVTRGQGYCVYDLDASAADVLIVGHTHLPFSRVLPDRRLVGNPGALLRDPAPGFDLVTPGTFGVLAIGDASATFEVRRAADGALIDGAQAATSR